MDIATLVVVVLVIAVALTFDFTNGFHDTANAMATSIATGALKPKTAVIAAGTLNLIGAFLSTEVAKTISGGIINEQASHHRRRIHICWIGRRYSVEPDDVAGWPSFKLFAMRCSAAWWARSSVGAGVEGVNFGCCCSPRFLSLLLFLLSLLAWQPSCAVKLIYFIVRQDMRRKVCRDGLPPWSDHHRMPGSAFARHQRRPEDHGHHHPYAHRRRLAAFWLRPSAVGCRCVRPCNRLGHLHGRLACHPHAWQGPDRDQQRLRALPPRLARATTILVSSHLGFALSTTQVCSGSIIGSGLGKKGGAIDWKVAARMLVAWLVTFPAAGVIGAAACAVAKINVWGTLAVAAIAVVAALIIFRLSRRNPINAMNVNEGSEVKVNAKVATAAAAA